MILSWCSRLKHISGEEWLSKWPIVDETLSLEGKQVLCCRLTKLFLHLNVLLSRFEEGQRVVATVSYCSELTLEPKACFIKQRVLDYRSWPPWQPLLIWHLQNRFHVQRLKLDMAISYLYIVVSKDFCCRTSLHPNILNNQPLLRLHVLYWHPLSFAWGPLVIDPAFFNCI